MFRFGDAVKINPHCRTDGHLTHGRVYYVFNTRERANGQIEVAVVYSMGKDDEWKSGWLPAGTFVRYKHKKKKSIKVWNRPGAQDV